jgi:tetratricopeptide (TPR) repeat protein
MTAIRPAHYILLALFFSVFVFLLHSRAFSGPMYYDSHAILAQMEHVFASGNVLSVIDLFPQRPIPMITFYFNYLIGGMDPYGFRIVNCFLLGTAAALTFVTIVLLLEASQARNHLSNEGARFTGVILVLLFLAHPAQAFIVIYIWQRAALLAIVFFMAALCMYLAVRMGKLHNPLLGYGLTGVFFVLAVFSKENALTLPFILLAAEIAFFRPNRKELVIRAIGMFVIVLLFLLAMSFLQRPHGDAPVSGLSATLAKYASEGGMSFWHLFLTQCRMLFSYISVVIFPTPSQVQMLTPQYISISLTEPWTTVPAVIGAISLVFTALLLLRKRPLTGFGLFFFILNLVPESFLVPQYVFVSYRVILPMIGLLMVAADAIVFLISRAGYERRIRRGLVSCAVLFIAFFSWVSMSKAALWQDPLIFWKDVVAHFPEDGPHLENRSRVQALNMVGFYLQRKERYAEAIEYHEKALELPNRREASSSFLGKAYLALGRVDDAERMFRLAIQANPTFPEGYLGVAAIMIKKNELAEAYRFTHSAIDIAPNNYGYQNLMGIVLLKQGKLAEAEKHFRMAMAINPQFPDAYYQLGKCALDKDPQNAIKLITHALALDPDHSLANTEIGVILAISGRLAEAESHFRRALKRDPNNELAQENLNIVERQISEMNGR